MVFTLRLERDNKIKNIDKKVVDLENKNKALQDEINGVE